MVDGAESVAVVGATLEKEGKIVAFPSLEGVAWAALLGLRTWQA